MMRKEDGAEFLGKKVFTRLKRFFVVSVCGLVEHAAVLHDRCGLRHKVRLQFKGRKQRAAFV